MPTITKINSARGIVIFSREDLAEFDLLKWIRADSKGWGNRNFLSIQPIERVAATKFKEKFPSDQVKLAEKCFLNDDGSVDVVLRITQDVSEGYYQKHPTKLTFLGKAQSERAIPEEVCTNKELEDRGLLNASKNHHRLFTPINFLEEHIAEFTDKDKELILTELRDPDRVGQFLSSLEDEETSLSSINNEASNDSLEEEEALFEEFLNVVENNNTD